MVSPLPLERTEGVALLRRKRLLMEVRREAEVLVERRDGACWEAEEGWGEVGGVCDVVGGRRATSYD